MKIRIFLKTRQILSCRTPFSGFDSHRLHQSSARRTPAAMYMVGPYFVLALSLDLTAQEK